MAKKIPVFYMDDQPVYLGANLIVTKGKGKVTVSVNPRPDTSIDATLTK